MKKIYTYLFIGLLSAIATFSSCKKDRIEDEGFESMDSFYDQNQEPEQEFTITSDTGGCIIAKKGTEICANRFDMLTSDGGSVSLPYSIKLIELYGAGDFILNKKPTTNSSNVLSSAGILKLTAYKDGKANTMASGKTMLVRLSSTNQENGMSIYQGDFPNNQFNDWSQASDGSTATETSGKYTLGIAKLGWNNTGKVKSTGTTTVTFSIKGSGTEHIQLFAKPDGYTGVIKGSNLTITNVPIGQNVTFIVFAKNSKGEFRLFNGSRTVTENMKIEPSFVTKTESELLAYIKSL